MGTGWEQKHNILGSRPQQQQPQLPYGAPQQQQQMFGAGGPYGGGGNQFGGGSMQQQSFGQQANFLSGGVGSGGLYGGGGMEGMMGGGAGVGGLASPVDVPSLVQQKGYNPVVFDTNPPRVSLGYF